MNKYKVTFYASAPSDPALTCDCCGTLIPGPQDCYIVEPDCNYSAYWVCSEQCVTTVILKDDTKPYPDKFL